MADSDEDLGFDDVGSIFEAPPSLDTYSAIYRQVLSAYQHCCALTGERFAFGEHSVHTSLRLVAIWPREEGGPLRVGNYLPLCAEAANAFRLGHFIVADTFAVIADLRVMDPALAWRLRPDGQLLLPFDALFAPDRALLAHHRAAVIRR